MNFSFRIIIRLSYQIVGNILFAKAKFNCLILNPFIQFLLAFGDAGRMRPSSPPFSFHI